jgi:hypothetical protein
MGPGRASKSFPKGTWKKTGSGLCVPRYTFLVVGRGSIGERVYDVVRASASCLRAQLVPPERALAWICAERPDHALFCGPDRHEELEAVRQLVGSVPVPPSTAFGLADTTPGGQVVLAAYAV